MSVNKAILVGRLGADPECRTSQTGTKICNLRLATDDRQKRPDGSWESVTDWHRVVCFGRTAENVERYCRKGKLLYVEGRIKTRKWTDRDGNDRWTTEIVADNIRFLGGKAEDGGFRSGGGDGFGGSGGGSYPQESFQDGGDADADIPF